MPADDKVPQPPGQPLKRVSLASPLNRRPTIIVPEDDKVGLDMIYGKTFRPKTAPQTAAVLGRRNACMYEDGQFGQSGKAKLNQILGQKEALQGAVLIPSQEMVEKKLRQRAERLRKKEKLYLSREPLASTYTFSESGAQTTRESGPNGRRRLLMEVRSFNDNVRRIALAYIKDKENQFWDESKDRYRDLLTAEVDTLAPHLTGLEGPRNAKCFDSMNNKLLALARHNASRKISLELEQKRLSEWPLEKVMGAVAETYREGLQKEAHEVAVRERKERTELLRENRIKMLRKAGNVMKSAVDVVHIFQTEAAADDIEWTAPTEKDEKLAKSDPGPHGIESALNEKLGVEVEKSFEDRELQRGVTAKTLKMLASSTVTRNGIYRLKSQQLKQSRRECVGEGGGAFAQWDASVRASELAGPAWQPLPPRTNVDGTCSEETSDDTAMLARLKDREYKGLVRDQDLKIQVGSAAYEAACINLGTLASSRVFEQIHNRVARLSHCGLAFKGATALAECLVNNAHVQELRVADNAFDEDAFVCLVKGIKQNKCIERLELSKNPGPGDRGIKELAVILNRYLHKMQILTELKLSSVNLTDRQVNELSKHLSQNRSVRTLDLSGNCIGDVGAGSLGVVFTENTTLRDVNLSWNNIKSPGAKVLAHGLKDSFSIHKFNISWNGLGDTGGGFFGEMMYTNNSIKELDMSYARVGVDACMVIAEGLKKNMRLEYLSLNGNPLGEEGGRLLMAAVEVSASLKHIGLQDSNFSGLKQFVSLKGKNPSSVQGYNMDLPDGHYQLDLGNPLHHAVVLELCHLENKQQQESIGCTGIKLNGRSLGNNGLLALGWPDSMPDKGNLELDFVSHHSSFRSADAIDEENLMKLETQLAGKLLSTRARMEMLAIFARSYYFECVQAGRLLQCLEFGKERIESACVLFARVVDAENLDVMIKGLTERERARFLDTLGSHRFFQARNATGHYALNLNAQVDWFVAAKIVELSRQEGEVLNWRNIKYNGMTYHMESCGPPEWKMRIPKSGLLTFDFTSYQHPNASEVATEAESDAIRDRLLKSRMQSRFSKAAEIRENYATQVSELRSQSMAYTLNADQAVKVVKMFPVSETRCEAAVVLYSRLAQWKIFWKVLQELDCIEQALVAERLGLGNVYNNSHNTGHWRLDLAHPEHYPIAKALVVIAQRDTKKQNWHNLVINGRRLKTNIVEGETMWSVLTTESFTPILEFDFVGPDLMDYLSKSAVGAASIASIKSKFESEEQQTNALVNEHVTREWWRRLRMMHPYWLDLDNPAGALLLCL
ncbi:hypothetical protein CYMTET_30231 [Cymbomonas tetramitiformis]|uniref:DUF4476 domain-containing protein n=1 Tax=Cymbomonas tetramitiformis TaxID=36881 RepID=A0AAE0FJH7_9CHLO|nr:hypothetical protein CYMTET_30231 [Cymbomonas tetramitiformis]